MCRRQPRTDALCTNLRPVAVSQDNAVARADQPHHSRSCLNGIFKLFLCCSFLPATNQGVSSDGDQNKF
jgi:hypothetical protein